MKYKNAIQILREAGSLNNRAYKKNDPALKVVQNILTALESPLPEYEVLTRIEFEGTAEDELLVIRTRVHDGQRAGREFVYEIPVQSVKTIYKRQRLMKNWVQLGFNLTEALVVTEV